MFIVRVVEVSTLPSVSVMVTVKAMSLTAACTSSRRRRCMQGAARGLKANHSVTLTYLPGSKERPQNPQRDETAIIFHT